MAGLNTKLKGLKAKSVFIQHKTHFEIKTNCDKNINNAHNLFVIKLRNQLELSSLVSDM